MQKLRVHDAASCDLDAQGAARHNIEFVDVTGRGLLDRERAVDRVRLSFDREPGLEEGLRILVRRESECCRFFSFQIDATEQVITVEVTAPTDKGAYLDGLYQATGPSEASQRRWTEERP